MRGSLDAYWKAHATRASTHGDVAKNTEPRVVVLNDVTQRIVDAQRGEAQPVVSSGLPESVSLEDRQHLPGQQVTQSDNGLQRRGSRNRAIVPLAAVT